MTNKALWQDEFARGVTVVQSRPAWITMDTGSVCNLRCVQCPREHPENHFVEHETVPVIADRVIEVLPTLERLTLYGLGEPLLSDLFWTLIASEGVRDIPSIDINTNGTLLSPRNVDRLLDSHLNFLKISVDGATQETYRRVRGGNLDKVLTGIKRLTDRRRERGRSDFRIWLVMTIMMENIRELPLMAEKAVELGVDMLWVQHLLMRSDGSQDRWRSNHNGWDFVYNDQHLSNAPELSDAMVDEAKSIMENAGLQFEGDADLWFRR